MARKIFIGAPLSTWEQRAFSQRLKEVLSEAGHDVTLPQDFKDEKNGLGLTAAWRRAVESADLVLALTDSGDVDPAAGFIMGLACALGVPIVELRTDFNPRRGTAPETDRLLESAAGKTVLATGNVFSDAVKAVEDE